MRQAEDRRGGSSAQNSFGLTFNITHADPFFTNRQLEYVYLLVKGRKLAALACRFSGEQQRHGTFQKRGVALRASGRWVSSSGTSSTTTRNGRDGLSRRP